jgi:hypothetical protein
MAAVELPVGFLSCEYLSLPNPEFEPTVDEHRWLFIESR